MLRRDLMPSDTPSTATRARHAAVRLYDDPGPFASVYLDVTRNTEDGEHIVEIRARDAMDALRSQGAPDSVIDPIRELLTANTHLAAPVSRMVVASERGVLLDDVIRVPISRPTTTWSGLPDLSAWLSDTDAGDFVLALVDHEGGDVAGFSPVTMQPHHQSSVGEKSPWEHKIKGGAWNQLNFQRSTETVWGRNADEVVDEIDRQLHPGVEFVVVGGDQDARSRVLDKLRQHERGGQVEIVELTEGSREADGSEDAIITELRQVVAARSVAHRLAAVHLLRDRLGQGHGATTGVSDTVDALVQGSVETLLLDPEALFDPERLSDPDADEQQIDPARHPGLALGAVRTDGPQRADLVLLAMALLTQAEPVITRSSTMGGAPVGAVLRW
jgi:hypothetical protein